MQSLPLANCPDTQQLVEYLQGLAESERVSLSRELHDELGGLLVSVVMDVAFAEQNLQIDDKLRQRLGRVRRTLAEAIDLKRKMIEHLRPSILDNFGLFQALQWEVKSRCDHAHLLWNESFYGDEPSMTKEALTASFRIGQEFLNVSLRQPSVKEIHLTVAVDADDLRIVLSHDGEAALAPDGKFALHSAAHRARAFNGQLTVAKLDGEGVVYCARLPLARLTQ
jgi:signal transduction histidine kinase